MCHSHKSNITKQPTHPALWTNVTFIVRIELELIASMVGLLFSILNIPPSM